MAVVELEQEELATDEDIDYGIVKCVRLFKTTELKRNDNKDEIYLRTGCEDIETMLSKRLKKL